MKLPLSGLAVSILVGLAISLEQEPAARGLPAPVEPSLRYSLSVDDQTLELVEGREARLRPDGPRYLLNVLPTRRFEVTEGFEFEYPRAFEFSGGGARERGWWNVASKATTLHLQSHDEDPAAVVERYVANSLAAGARDRGSRELVLGTRALKGRLLELELGGLNGWRAGATQEVYGFSAGGCSWLLMIQRTLREPTELEVDLKRRPDGDLAPVERAVAVEDAETTEAVRILAATFRFHGG